MMDVTPTYVPFVPSGRPTGSERLGLGQVSARPETARALNAPEEGNAKAPFSERQAAIDAGFAQQQALAAGQGARANRSFAELGARARVAAGGESNAESGQSATGSGTTSRDERESAVASSAMRQRVEIAVRLALPSEERSRQFNILV